MGEPEGFELLQERALRGQRIRMGQRYRGRKGRVSQSLFEYYEYSLHIQQPRGGGGGGTWQWVGAGRRSSLNSDVVLSQGRLSGGNYLLY